ncbi:amino acid ABC transporter substrate-binding protein [Moraxella haemolytica]|uniref:amino acid ABC transporter substrate-binding protein n=1 Tax=Moraxella haemolytica TaxID=2904119 RepID=UPI00254277F0|nr:amino acid ABC transporter substrate-binding protein [Moraxella sp. ZY171148]WII95882.1 amino acid ABC transporter substrate-binding protein [Moraxella sp. ZY171148]
MTLLKTLPFLMVATMLAACGNQSQPQTKEATNQTTDTTTRADETDLYKRIVNGGVLVVGTEGTYPPFTYHDETGKLTGYDVEVVRAIADKLGMKVEFKETQWDGMLSGLDAGRFDVVANQVSLTTPERQAKYNKSEPYSWSNAVLVAPKNIHFGSWEEIKGKKSAQSLTSNYSEMAQKYGAQIVAVDGLAQAVELVKTGRADMTINDHLAVLDYLKTKSDSDLEIKLSADDSEKRGAGVIFRKDETASVEKFNEATKALQADGTLTKLSNEFFGADISQK